MAKPKYWPYKDFTKTTEQNFSHTGSMGKGSTNQIKYLTESTQLF